LYHLVQPGACFFLTGRDDDVGGGFRGTLVVLDLVLKAGGEGADGGLGLDLIGDDETTVLRVGDTCGEDLGRVGDDCGEGIGVFGLEGGPANTGLRLTDAGDGVGTIVRVGPTANARVGIGRKCRRLRARTRPPGVLTIYRRNG